MAFDIKEKGRSVGGSGTEAWRMTPARKPDPPRESVASQAGGYIRNAIALAPIAVGGVVAFNQVRGNASITGNVIGRIQAAADAETAPTMLHRISAKQSEWETQQLRMHRDQIRTLAMLEGNLAGETDLMKSQFSAASLIGDPNARLLRQRISGSTDPLGLIIDEMGQHINAGRPMPYGLARTVRGFQRRLRGFEKHVKAGGSIGVFQPMKVSPPEGVEAAIPSAWKQEIAAIEEMLGGARTEATLYSRRGSPGGYYRLQFSGGILAKKGLNKAVLDIERTLTRAEHLALNIPEDLVGSYSATGMSQQTIRGYGMFEVIENNKVTSSLNHPRFVLNQARIRLAQAVHSGDVKNERQLRRVLSGEFRGEMLGYGQVFAGYTADDNPALRLQMEIAGRERHMFGPGFSRFATGDETAGLVREGGYYPAGTPKKFLPDIPKQRPPKLTTLDPASLHLGGELFPGSRKPFQFAKGIATSDRAVDWLSNFPPHRDTEYLLTEKVKETIGPYGAPRFRRALLSSKYTDILETMGIGEGEEGISRSIAPAFETTRYRPVELEAESVNMALFKQGSEEIGPGRHRFKTPLTIGDPILGIGEGQIAGIVATGADAGKEFELRGPVYRDLPGGERELIRRGDRVLEWQEIAKSEMTDGGWKSTIRLNVAQDIPFTDVGKRFQQRATARVLTQREIELALSATGSRASAALGLVSGLGPMDEVRKNRSSHNRQMFGELVESTKELMRRASIKAGRSSRDLSNPGNYTYEKFIKVRDNIGTSARPSRMHMDPGAQVIAEALTNNPASWNKKLIDSITATAKGATARSPGSTMAEMSDAYIRKMWMISKQLHLPGPAIGGIFGAVPEIWGLGDLGPEELGKALIGKGFRGITPEEAREIHTGVAYEIGTSYPGGTRDLVGAGSIGSLEPRAFEQMGGAHFGPLGKVFQEEFIERVARDKPELLIEQTQLGGAFYEFAGQKHGVNFGDLPTYSFGDLSPESLNVNNEYFVGKTGGIINFDRGTGLNRLVIPKDLSLMGASGDISGDTFEAPLMKQYGSFLEDVSSYSAGKLDRGGLEASSKTMREALWKGYTGSVVGKHHGLMSSEIKGSRFLYIASPPRGMKLPAFTHGVPRAAAEGMFEEMDDLYSPEAMHQMKKEFFEEGKRVPAWTFRHPAIHEFSGQPAYMQLVEGPRIKGDTIYVAEARRIASEVSGGKIIGKIGGLGKIDIGPLRGTWADKDADTLMISAVRPETGRQVDKLFNKEFIAQYDEINIRNQILENAIKRGEGYSLPELAGMGEDAFRELKISEDIADAIKLGTPNQYVGKISTQLSHARRAVEFSDVGKAEKIGLESVFSLLEQLPIAGKHLSSKDVLSGHLEESFQTISSAVKRGMTPGGAKEGAAELLEAMRGMYKDSPIAQRLFAGEDISIRIAEEEADRVVKGMPLKQWEGSLASAFEQYSAPGIDGLSEAARQRFARGQATPTVQQAGKVLASKPWLLGEVKIPLGQTGKMATASRVAQAAMNEATVMGKKAFGLAKKPLAWGFGASLAIGALLSRPVSNLEAGASDPPPNALLTRGGSTTVSPEDLGADGQQMGNPSTPNYPGPGTARISPPGRTSPRVRVHGKSPKGMDYGAMTDKIMKRIGRTGRSNVNVRDKRTSLTNQRISEMLGS